MEKKIGFTLAFKGLIRIEFQSICPTYSCPFSFLHSFLLSFLHFFHIKTFPSFPLLLSLLHFLPSSRQSVLPEPSSSGSFSGSSPALLWGELAKTTTTVKMVGSQAENFSNFGDSISSKRVQSRFSCVQNYKTEHFLHLHTYIHTRPTHRPLMPSLIPSATVGIITSYRRRRTKKNVHLNANQDVRIM